MVNNVESIFGLQEQSSGTKHKQVRCSRLRKLQAGREPGEGACAKIALGVPEAPSEECEREEITLTLAC